MKTIQQAGASMIVAIALLAPGLGRAQSVVSTILGGAPDGAPVLSATLAIPTAVTADKSGNVYVALKGSHQVVKIDTSSVVRLVAGNGNQGYSGDGGQAKSAALNTPAGLALDSSGNLYISDSAANVVRCVSTSGIITTVAGTGTAGSSGDGGSATSALLYGPTGLSIDGSGSLLIADTGNNVIRIVSGGIISKLAGNGTRGSSASGAAALSAHLNQPQGVVYDSSSGTVFIADTGNNWIYQLASDNTLVLYGGVNSSSSGYGTTGDPTIATNATLATPTSLAVDSSGNLYFVEYGAPRVRRITTAGKIASYAGTGTGGTTGDGGLARDAQLNVIGIGMMSNGNLLIADGVTDKVRIVTAADGIINTYAGNGVGSFNPRGMALKGTTLYFSDTSANVVRSLDISSLTLSLVAGNGTSGFQGDGYAANTAEFNAPRGVAVDSSGNIYIADSGNNRVRKVGTDGKTSTFAGNGTATTGSTGTATISGDGSAATFASLHQPAAVAVDSSGNVYIAEQTGHVVRKVNTSGIISTVAGTGTAGAPDSETGVAVNQTLSYPQGLWVDSSNNVYIADTNNYRIRKLTSDGTITTVAGTGTSGSTGDGGQATAATLKSPLFASTDSYGNLYVADSNNNKLRRVAPDGVIGTIAGTGSAAYNGDGTPATAYPMSGPSVVFPGTGCNVLVADTGNGRIRQVSPGIDYTITSSPTGLQIVLDGTATTTPATATFLPGTHHTLSAPSLQSGTTGTQYLYSGSQDFDVSCGAGRATLAMNFTPQYLLSIASDRGGSVSPSAAYFTTGTSVKLTATATTGYTFTGWEGACKGTGTCTVSMTAPMSVKADFAPTTTLKPAISTATGAVEGAGFSVPAVTALSPDGIMTVWGSGFAPSGELGVVSSSTLVNGAISTEMDGVCVLVGSSYAPILAVTATQVNFQVPETVATTGTVPVQVVTSCGSSSAQTSTATAVAAQSAAPEFFYFVQNSSGVNPIAAANATTGVYVGKSGLISGVTFTPAKPGDILTLYATGLGLTTPQQTAGALPSSAAWITGTYKITMGGTTLSSSDILYVGVTPYIAGLYQINLRVPSTIANGDQSVVVTVNGYSSPSGAYITVQQ